MKFSMFALSYHSEDNLIRHWVACIEPHYLFFLLQALILMDKIFYVKSMVDEIKC